MIRRENAGSTAVTPFHGVREAVGDPGVHHQLAVPALDERAFELGEHRPDQASAAMIGIDQHVEQRRASSRPSGAGDREADEPVRVEDRGHHRPSGHHLLSHLLVGERANAPLGALQLQHSRP